LGNFSSRGIPVAPIVPLRRHYRAGFTMGAPGLRPVEVAMATQAGQARA
jgi:antitoxin (DNA-binding transcriptional repressor) of toxin-antitoxin stability system